MYESKKIAFFGTGGVFSNIVLKYLIDKNIHISLVVILVKKNSNLKPMNDVLCKKVGIDYIIIYKTNTDYLLNSLTERNIDLGIVASYSQILKPSIIQATKDGFINVHPSFLPYYRGANPVFWQIKDLKDDFGVSVHRINEKIDEGEILAQAMINLADIHSANEIFSEIAIKGSELLIELIESYNMNGKLESIIKGQKAKITDDGFYNPKPVDTDFEVSVFDINPISLKKLVSRLKKWGDAYFFYKGTKIAIDTIEDIDLKITGNDIKDICENRWRINGKHGSYIAVTKENFEE
ncbi:MAG: formyltransferase family protein [Bacilli bacterium]|nr:formyltransferase family protein [Bacilli bacterium]